MALYERVAEERGEALGETVGYAVRGASKRSAKTRILFVTTGVLLSALGAGVDATLGALSHVILDEVHERSLLCDFCLTLLRDSISAAGAAAPSGRGQSVVGGATPRPRRRNAVATTTRERRLDASTSASLTIRPP